MEGKNIDPLKIEVLEEYNRIIENKSLIKDDKKWCWCQVRCTIYSCSFEDPLETVYIILRSILCLSNIVLWQVSLFLFRSYCNPLHFFWIGMGKYNLLLVRQGLGKSCKNQAILKIDEWDGCWKFYESGIWGVWMFRGKNEFVWVEVSTQMFLVISKAGLKE